MTRYIAFLFSMMFFFYINGCSRHASEGVYIDQREPIFYLELKPEGKFYLKGENQSAGTYDVEEGGITLITGDGKALRFRLKADTLINNENGHRWVLWHSGKNGLDYEKAFSEVHSKTQELWQLVDQGKLTEQDAERQTLDLSVQNGFMSPEEAKEAFERFSKESAIRQSIPQPRKVPPSTVKP